MFELRRQFRADVDLRPAQDERLDLRGDGGLPLFLFRVRCLRAEMEVAVRAEIAGQEEIEQRPYFDQVVFDGRAGQDQLVLGTQPLAGLGVGGLRILDVLRFVENQMVEIHAFVFEAVAPQVDGPVIQKRRGADDERRADGEAEHFPRKDQRKGLDGLAETHFIGENAVEAAFLQRVEPFEAVRLVGAERPFQGRRDGRQLDFAMVEDAVFQLLPLRLGAVPIFVQFVA